MITFSALLLITSMLPAANDDPPSWSEVLKVAATYLTETGGAPLRADPDPGDREFVVSRPDSAELVRRRLTMFDLRLNEISYHWVTWCYASFTLPPPKDPPFVHPKCLYVPRDGSVAGFDDPVREGRGWKVRATLVNRDVMMSVELHLEMKDGRWELIRAEREIFYNY